MTILKIVIAASVAFGLLCLVLDDELWRFIAFLFLLTAVCLGLVGVLS